MAVVVPLAAVLGSLRYHSGLWPIVFLAVAAAASVMLVEIGSNGEAAEPVREARLGDD